MWKKLSTFLVVLLVASCLLSAFPSSKKPLEVKEAPVQEVPTTETVEESLQQEAPQEVVEPSEEVKRVEELEHDLATMSETLKSLQSEVDSTKVMTSGKKEEIDSLVGQIASDVEIVLADLEEKEAIIAELAEANSAQADQIAYIQGRYDKELATKFYANVGGVIGFKGNAPTWGVTGNIGLRFGKGLLIGTGVQYMVGTFTAKPFDLGIDNLSINVTVGWEW